MTERNERKERDASAPSHAPNASPQVKELGEITSLRIGAIAPNGVAHADYETADGETGCGYLRPVHDGKPMQPGERLLDVHAEGHEGKRPVKEIYRAPRGPARVNSDAYRVGYDAVFGKKGEAGRA